MTTSMTTSQATPSHADATADAPHTEPSTTSGLRFSTTAKGYLQPEFVVRYASAQEALDFAAADAFALYDKFADAAHERGLRLVTEQA